ncbi:MAG: phytanoyl-CoA dioxygenase family protein [Planctomycetota bacterium]|nr:phytanoyl-CoA dioxygenase family protein [Planctomycetota bacterium]
MTFPIDTKLSWTDHYVEHGFAVLRNLASPDFVRDAMAEVAEMLGHGLPPTQWTAENSPARSRKPVSQMPALQRVYDDPGIRNIIDTMFGSPDHWNGQRQFQLFLNPYDEAAKAEVSPAGHIDFVSCPVPIFGSGFMFQVALSKSEPFSGNITIYPGTHKAIQRALVENPDLQYPKDLQPLLECEPYEFVAEPGDVLVFHHLVGHAGNYSHAANRRPRVVLHCQGLRKTWLHEIDPASPTLSPWERSLAFTGGRYKVRQDEYEWIVNYKRKKQEAKAAAV